MISSAIAPLYQTLSSYTQASNDQTGPISKSETQGLRLFSGAFVRLRGSRHALDVVICDRSSQGFHICGFDYFENGQPQWPLKGAPKIAEVYDRSKALGLGLIASNSPYGYDE